VVVLDFGPATRPDLGVADTETAPALTTAGMILGTPRYLSPEQLGGGVADARDRGPAPRPGRGPGRDVGVGSIVEGSVLPAGNRAERLAHGDP